MTAPARAVRLSPPVRESPLHGATLFAASAALDVATLGILLVGTPQPLPQEALAAAITHGAAVLLLSGLGPLRPSRRWLALASVLAIPLAGAVVAAVSWTARGDGSIVLARRRRSRPRPVVTMAAVKRLGSALSPCDALECGNEDQRRSALAALGRRRDSEAIALLRRAAAGRDPDLALSAALTLDEIGEQAERRVVRRDRAEVRHGAG